MRVYQIGPDGLYVGYIDADPNPRRPGQFLIPAGCVTAMPPEALGRRARYMDSGWRLEDIPTVPFAPEPVVPITKSEWNTVKEKVAFLLAIADRHIAEAAASGAPIPPEWVSYRTELSAITSAEAGPTETVTWPDVPPPIERPVTLDTLGAYASAKRYQVETGGIMLNGARIDTSRESMGLILAAFQLSQATSQPVDFKAANGFVTLDPNTMKTIAIMAGLHVQGCFSAERKILEKIAAGEITTREQIDAYPWSSNH